MVIFMVVIRAMKQVLEGAELMKKKNMLIGLGDYADGWPGSI
jgi:hypothetical protein